MSTQRAKRLQTILQVAFAILILAAVHFLIQVGVHTGYKEMSTDSGVFAYCGERILSGDVLYRDCWDNKPPAVYYLNAVALLAGGKSLWSIWLFQLVWVWLESASFYLILRHIWGNRIAFILSLVFSLTLLHPDYFAGGNLTESYAVLPIVLSIGAFHAYLRSAKKSWLVVLGVLAGFAFLLKPTYIAIPVAIGVVLLFLGWQRGNARRSVAEVAWIAIPSLLILTLTAAYWLAQGALSDLWYAVFIHNRGYVQSGVSLQSLYGTARLYAVSQPLASVFGLAILSLVAFFADTHPLIVRKNGPGDLAQAELTPGLMAPIQARNWLVVTLGLSIVLDAILVAISGKNFGHYVQVALPALVASLAYLLWRISKFFHSPLNIATERVILVAAVIVFGLAWALEIGGKEIPSRSAIVTMLANPEQAGYHMSDVERYIFKNTQPSQSVLMWGAQPSINFLTGRRSPTRFVFTPHLFTPTPEGEDGFAELLSELEEDPPAMIVIEVYSSAGLPTFDPSQEIDCPTCTSGTLQGMQRLQAYINTRYRFSNQIREYAIYELLGE